MPGSTWSSTKMYSLNQHSIGHQTIPEKLIFNQILYLCKRLPEYLCPGKIQIFPKTFEFDFTIDLIGEEGTLITEMKSNFKSKPRIPFS